MDCWTRGLVMHWWVTRWIDKLIDWGIDSLRDMWINRQMNQRINKSMAWWIDKFMGWWTNGLIEWWIDGWMDWYTTGMRDKFIKGYMDQLDLRMNRPMDWWIDFSRDHGFRDGGINWNWSIDWLISWLIDEWIWLNWSADRWINDPTDRSIDGLVNW